MTADKPLYSRTDPVYVRLLDALIKTPIPATIKNGGVDMNPHKVTEAILLADPAFAGVIRDGMRFPDEMKAATEAVAMLVEAAGGEIRVPRTLQVDPPDLFVDDGTPDDPLAMVRVFRTKRRKKGSQ